MARGIRRPASNRLHGPRAPFAASALQPLQLADSEMDSELIAGAAATQCCDQTVGRQPSLYNLWARSGPLSVSLPSKGQKLEGLGLPGPIPGAIG